MLEQCGKHKVGGNAGLFCFVNSDGTHIDPRQCTCLKVKIDGVWIKWSPSREDVSAWRLRTNNPSGVKADYLNAMQRELGKLNPSCPIEDPHAPVDPEWWKG